MTLSRRFLLAGGTLGAAFSGMPAGQAAAPKPLSPWGAVPSRRQLVWHMRRQYGFVHLGINTFTGREWGLGDESPSLFDPSDFSADQIVAALRAGGLNGLVLTAKHHDGFCLWPTRLTEHCIRNSPFRNGKGDLVGEMAAACRAQGMPFGLYLSPWDRNHADYGRPAYLDYYRAQLRELLTRYGPIFEMWFDGANGGDGFYGGAREMRRIDAATYYDWPRIWDVVREVQPQTIIWGAPGSDARWVGNEEGVAGDPCRPTMPALPVGGLQPDPFLLEHGQAGGPVWWPAETDVSIRPGWFWHPDQDDQVMSVARLVRLGFESVGRGTNLILNMPPDRRGRIPDIDARRVARWHRIRTEADLTDVATGSVATASSMADASHPAGAVLDPDPDRFWCAAVTDAVLELALAGERRFDVVRLREYLPLGLRAVSVTVAARRSGQWADIAAVTTIGNERMIRLDDPVVADGLRLSFRAALAPPTLAHVALLLMPPVPVQPVIARKASGRVAIEAGAGVPLLYRLDGGPWRPYVGAFALDAGGVVEARPRAGDDPDAQARQVLVPLETRWRVVAASAPGADTVLGDDPQGVWTSPASPAEPAMITVDLGTSRRVSGFTFLPARLLPTGTVAPDRWVLEASLDDRSWRRIGSDEFSNIAANADRRTIRLLQPVDARFVRLLVDQAGGSHRIGFTGWRIT